MIKSMALLSKKPGISDEEFYYHWKEIHGPLAVKLIPGMKKYIQDHLVKLPGVINEFNGIAEVWFDDLKAWQYFMSWRQTDEAKTLIDDENKFIDKSRRIRLIVEEHPIK